MPRKAVPRARKGSIVRRDWGREKRVTGRNVVRMGRFCAKMFTRDL